MILACVFAAIAPGCGKNPNEIADADAKVVLPPNAPKTQEEYYKQSQEASKKQSKARKGARR